MTRGDWRAVSSGHVAGLLKFQIWTVSRFVFRVSTSQGDHSCTYTTSHPIQAAVVLPYTLGVVLFLGSCNRLQDVFRVLPVLRRDLIAPDFLLYDDHWPVLSRWIDLSPGS